MEYDYIPLPQRPPLRWPGGHRVALLITLNLETWDLVKDTEKPYYAGGPAILPDVLPGNVPDFPNYSWREYGQRVAAAAPPQSNMPRREQVMVSVIDHQDHNCPMSLFIFA